MNKTLYIIIAGIAVVAGLVGYTMFGQSNTETTPHDDSGLAPHTD